MTDKRKIRAIVELKMIQADLHRYTQLFPYEQEYILHRIRKYLKEHADIAGPDLTKDIEDSIKDLTNLR